MLIMFNTLQLLVIEYQWNLSNFLDVDFLKQSFLKDNKFTYGAIFLSVITEIS